MDGKFYAVTGDPRAEQNADSKRVMTIPSRWCLQKDGKTVGDGTDILATGSKEPNGYKHDDERQGREGRRVCIFPYDKS